LELFDIKKDKEELKSPLAWRFYPRNFSDFVGQEEILSKGKLLRKLIESDSLRSAVFFGPTGVGKTALVRLIANITSKRFVECNAVIIGVKELASIIKESEYFLKRGKQTLLLIDELHHFNKTQQDVLLPHVERGIINFIGITSENPFYFLNKALLSRVMLFFFFFLKKQDLIKILKKAISSDLGLKKEIRVSDDVVEKIATVSNGDARKALNILEVLYIYGERRNIVEEDFKKILNKRIFSYDKKGDEHYNTISAFIKSIRGSDPDAALYWLAKLISLGEDPRFIVRRLLILASEDIGLAEPFAIVMASSVANAVEKVGMPEAKIILSELVIYLSLLPKSNSSYKAIESAFSYFENEEELKVPEHLTKKGGKFYKYPHSFGGYVEQEYIPGKVKFLELKGIGYEQKLIDYIRKTKNKRGNKKEVK